MPEHAEVKPLTSNPTKGLSKTEIGLQNQEEEDSDWVTVDEQFVHVEINGLYRDDVLKSCSSNTGNGSSEACDDQNLFQLTGLETSEPILQIGRQVFAGVYSDSADTSVFFRCSESENTAEDEVFSQIFSRLSAKLEWKTKKKLTFKRVFLKPHDPELNDGARDQSF